jgi:ubiquinol-cytochrome c reductase iron-sulfur subunit
MAPVDQGSDRSDGNGSAPAPAPASFAVDVLVGGLLLTTTVAALALVAVYVGGGQVQAEGVLLAVALGALAVAVAVWAKRFMPQGPFTEERPVRESSPELRAAVVADLQQGERTVLRRRILATMLGGAVGSLGLAAIVPLRSLGPSPLPDLRRTGWSRGRRLVDDHGRPVPLDRLAVDSVLTVFPEGATAQEREDSQVTLLRVAPGVLALPAERQGWTPEDHVAFSRVCTHAGCPVGLYQAETHQLVCPCHQSLFDVTAGAKPVFGPASRPLPQLPLAVRDGVLVADGDFPEPVGPGFWSWDRP